MTQPQARAKNATEARIVQAAAQLFSRQGYNGTSTREIAHLAGVNEVTIYRHFIRKEELFWAAVDSQLGNLRVNQALQEALEGEGESPESVIGLFFEFLVDVVVRQPDLVRLLGFSALELGPGADLMTRKHLSPLFCDVAAYLEKCSKRGTLCTIDPFITVLGFASTVIANQCAYQVVTGRESRFESVDEAVAGFTKYWSQALSPMQERTSIQPKSKTATAISKGGV